MNVSHSKDGQSASSKQRALLQTINITNEKYLSKNFTDLRAISNETRPNNETQFFVSFLSNKGSSNDGKRGKEQEQVRRLGISVIEY